MYSLLHRKENAHDDSIWTVAWGKVTRKEEAEKDNGENHDENSRDSIHRDPPSEFIVTGSVDDLVKVWRFHNDRLELEHRLEGHALGVVSVAISSDGNMCASTSLDSSLRLWDLVSGEKIGSIDVGPVEIWTCAFSPDDKFVISGNHAGKINMYGVESKKHEKVLDTRGKFALSIAYSPDGKYIASGAIDGMIDIFDVESGKLVHALEGHAMPIRSLCFSPDSQLLLTASDDGHMKLYDVQHANAVGTLSGHASWVLSVAFSPDNKHFVSSSSDHTVKVWELKERQCISTLSVHTDQVWGVKYNPEGNKVVSCSEDRSINIYDCPT